MQYPHTSQKCRRRAQSDWGSVASSGRNAMNGTVAILRAMKSIYTTVGENAVHILRFDTTEVIFVVVAEASRPHLSVTLYMNSMKATLSEVRLAPCRNDRISPSARSANERTCGAALNQYVNGKVGQWSSLSMKYRKGINDGNLAGLWISI